MDLKRHTPEELGKILELHKKWLRGDADGVRADLSGVNLRRVILSETDLRDANLHGADLREAVLNGVSLLRANLHGADLRGTDLRDANLRGADLREASLGRADLRRADLRDTDLREANLRGADLSVASLWRANLRRADLRRADLRGTDIRKAVLIGADLENAKGLPPIACPEIGSFIGFKKTCDAIVELEILEDARRSSAAGRKCRCDKAKVLSITDFHTGSALTETQSQYDCAFIYRVGEIVSVDNFDPDRWNECAPGIHFFITRQEAVDY